MLGLAARSAGPLRLFLEGYFGADCVLWSGFYIHLAIVGDHSPAHVTDDELGATYCAQYGHCHTPWEAFWPPLALASMFVTTNRRLFKTLSGISEVASMLYRPCERSMAWMPLLGTTDTTLGVTVTADVVVVDEVLLAAVKF